MKRKEDLSDDEKNVENENLEEEKKEVKDKDKDIDAEERRRLIKQRRRLQGDCHGSDPTAVFPYSTEPY